MTATLSEAPAEIVPDEVSPGRGTPVSEPPERVTEPVDVAAVETAAWVAYARAFGRLDPGSEDADALARVEELRLAWRVAYAEWYEECIAAPARAWFAEHGEP